MEDIMSDSPRINPCQDSLSDQIKEMRRLAIKAKLYDADDWVRKFDTTENEE